MNVGGLMAELEATGIQVWREGSRLRFRAPRGAMTDEWLGRLRAAKEELLAQLPDLRSVEGENATEALWVAEPETRHEPFGLTDIQSAYLLGRDAAFDYGGVSCHIYLEFRWPVRLEPTRLQQAWDGLVARHDMLRCVISQDGTQRILPELSDTRIPVTDVRHGDRDAVESAVATVRADLSHRVHPPGERPMYELRLTRTTDGDLLHLSMDFMVLDWISIQLLLTELDRRYRAPECELPPIGASFRDYVAAEARLREGERYARDRDYWFRRVDELPAAPTMPLVDNQAAGAAPARFRRYETALSEEQWRSLKRRAGARGITPANVVLAAYAEVIGRWSATDRFALGITLLNRMPLHPDVDRLLGDFTSVSLLAVDQAGRACFADRAAQLGERLFEDLDHRLCGGVEVLRELARRRGRQAALMPVVFTGGIGVADRALEGTDRPPRPEYGISQTPQVWIDCQATDQFGGLEVNWDVREGVFPEGMAQEMAEACAGLLQRLAERDAPWSEADPLGLPAAQRDRRELVNDTAAPVPDGLLHGPLVTRARTTPDATAVRDHRGILTYGEWLGRAGWVARELRAAGCRPGDLVAVPMDKSCEQVVGVLGVLLAGGAYVPVDTGQPAARQQRILASSGAGLAVVAGDVADEVMACVATAVDVRAAEKLPLSEVAEAEDVTPDDVAYVIHTSGSTGEPKGVVISHRAAANTVHDINQRFSVDGQDVVLGLAALSFDLSVYDLFGPPARGAPLVLPSPERRGDPSHWAELLERHGVTLWNSVPAQLHMLVHYLDTEPGELTSPRLAMLSGDWIPLSLPGHAGRYLPRAELVSLGGATEAAIWSIHHRIGEVPAGWRSVPYGTPLANQRFHVFDSALRDCPDWVPGELFISGTGLADGYLHDPERTAERFFHHPDSGLRLYRTGDLGRYLPDGEIEFLGRADHQVKIRGHRVEPGEIDAVLGEHPDVGGNAVVVTGTDALERALVAFVAPAVRARSADTDADARVAAAADAVSAALPSDEAPTRAEAEVYTRHLHRAFGLSMARALHVPGMSDGATGVRTEDIADRLRVADRHRGLLRRWLRALQRDGAIAYDADEGTWWGLRLPSADEVRQAWDELAEHAVESICPPELLRYFRGHEDRLPALLRGEADAVRLFFPGGSQEIARAWYADNYASRHILETLGAAVRGAAAEPDGATGRPSRPVRVLEVGGGIGAATGPVLEALGDIPVDYLFTDVSEYFLADARERFGAQPGVRFGLFDMNADPLPQGLRPSSFDVVISAGALNNARDTRQVLDRLRSLAAPQGWLFLLEMTREHPEITATQAFMMEEPEDLRGEQDTVFLSLSQWRELLHEVGGPEVRYWPAEDSPLAPLGQHVLGVPVKHDRAAVTPEQIARWLAERLPDHMVPTQVQLVDELPLTANGKVDRKRLLEWVPQQGERVAEQRSEPPRTDVEWRLAALWAELLGGEPPAREQGFFESGGDSLLAARLVGRIRADLPGAAATSFDVLLRRLLNTPTIAALAKQLEPSGSGSGPGAVGSEPGTFPVVGRSSAGGGAGSLVDLGGTGSGPVRLLVHEGLGTLAPYRELATELTADGRLVGLAVEDGNHYLRLPVGSLVEDLAAEYARQVLAAGHREVEVVGYCSGGLIAAELARSLTGVGVSVSGLTVVSSYRIPYLLQDELMVEYAFARVMGGDLAALGWPADEGAMGRALDAALASAPGLLRAGALAALDGDAGLASVASRFRRLGERDLGIRKKELHAALAATPAGLGSAEHVEAMYRVFEHTVEAVTRYDPLPYAGDITFLRPRVPTHFIPGLQDDMTRFWSDLCLGELTVVDVPGDHFGCIRPPHVAATAGAITGRSE